MTDFEQRFTDAQASELYTSCNNWGRWGNDDERGTLNYITSENIVAASKLITVGKTVSLAHDIATRYAPNNPRPAVHVMQHMGTVEGATEFLGIMWHGFSTTHVDALCHEFHHGKFYNGFDVAENLPITGSKKVSVMTMKDGIFTRGVLLDIPRTEKKKWLEVGERVHVDDLERAEAAAGVRVGKGDILVVRVGGYPRMAEEGIESAFSPQFVRAGLDADCIPWIHEREVALFGGDCIERMPSGYPSLRMPLHQIGVIYMGMPLLDHLAVEELAATCEDLNRWEFALTFAPWRIRGGTGSAINPTAIF